MWGASEGTRMWGMRGRQAQAERPRQQGSQAAANTRYPECRGNKPEQTRKRSWAPTEWLTPILDSKAESYFLLRRW